MEVFHIFLLLSTVVLSAVSVFKAVQVLFYFLAVNKAKRKQPKKEFLPEHIRRRILKIRLLENFLRKYTRKRYIKRIKSEMPEAVRLLYIALDSGSSMLQAFSYAAKNCTGALSYELKQTVWDIEAGLDFDEAMKRLQKRCPCAELSYLAAAMEIQHRCGGSMSEILQSVSSTLHQNIKMEQKLDMKTAQARLSSRIVAIMPFALLALLSIFSSGYLSMFFSSGIGILLFICALGLDFVGIILIRRFLTIDLNMRGGETL